MLILFGFNLCLRSRLCYKSRLINSPINFTAQNTNLLSPFTERSTPRIRPMWRLWLKSLPRSWRILLFLWRKVLKRQLSNHKMACSHLHPIRTQSGSHRSDEVSLSNFQRHYASSAAFDFALWFFGKIDFCSEFKFHNLFALVIEIEFNLVTKWSTCGVYPVEAAVWECARYGRHCENVEKNCHL